MRQGSTSSTGTSSTHHPRGEQGIALIVALLSIMLMTALGMALMLTSQTETLISANYRDSMEGAYVADAGIERVMDDVLTIPDWNTVLASPDGVTAGVTSGFHDSSPSSPITLPDGRTINLARATNMINCAKTTTCSDSDMDTSTDRSALGQEQPEVPPLRVGSGGRSDSDLDPQLAVLRCGVDCG